LPAATKKNYEKSKSVFTVCGLRFEPRFSWMRNRNAKSLSRNVEWRRQADNDRGTLQYSPRWL
jgi:hypothetical protein